MKTLKQFTSEIEIYSIDEAFLNLSSIKHENLLGYGNLIRKTVLKWTGIPTSIGIARTKTLSKAANHIAKKDLSGVISLINEKKIEEILKQIKINDVWGVGKKLTNFYIKNHINTAYDLRNISANWIKKNTNVLGSRTAMELQGIPCISLDSHDVKRKNCYTNIPSFFVGRNIYNLEKINYYNIH